MCIRDRLSLFFSKSNTIGQLGSKLLASQSHIHFSPSTTIAFVGHLCSELEFRCFCMTSQLWLRSVKKAVSPWVMISSKSNKPFADVRLLPCSVLTVRCSNHVDTTRRNESVRLHIRLGRLSHRGYPVRAHQNTPTLKQRAILHYTDERSALATGSCVRRRQVE